VPINLSFMISNCFVRLAKIHRRRLRLPTLARESLIKTIRVAALFCSDPDSERDMGPYFTETVAEAVLFFKFGSLALETDALIPIVAPDAGFETTGMVI
jgi:hypothetical protein